MTRLALHAALSLAVLSLAACDGTADPDAGTPIDAPAFLDAVTPTPDSGSADAGPAAGTLDIAIDGLPSGADAWIAVTSRGVGSQWIREPGRLALEPGPVVVAAAPVEVAGVTYAPTPTLVEPDLTAAPGEVTITYAAATTDFFDVAPDFSTCTPGVASDDSRERAVAMLHFIRTLVGVPPVGYDEAAEPPVREAALVYANSDSPDPHAPPNDATCYTTGAYEAAGTSNLRWVGSSSVGNVADETPESFVRFWGTDRNVRSLGHRRWLIDPFMPRVSFAMTYGDVQPGPYARSFTYIASSAMEVIHDDDASIDGWTVDYVAYPVGDFPAALIDLDEFPYLSFSAMADPTSRWGANQDVDFGAATVTVTDGSGAPVPVTDVDSDTRGVGLPNQISWRVDGLSLDETYSVAITGAQVAGAIRDYEYVFTLR